MLSGNGVLSMNRVKAVGPNGYTLCKKGHEMTSDNVASNGACKRCRVEYDKKYYADNKERVNARTKRYNAINSEKIREYQAEYYSANSEEIKARSRRFYSSNADRISSDSKIYRATNQEKIKSRGKQYYAANSEKLKMGFKKYKKNNREKFRLLGHKRRAILNNDGGSLSKGISERLLTLQKGRCRICKSKVAGGRYHLDHIVPISKGGPNVDRNIQVLCPTCNLKKQAKLPHIYAQELGVLFF